MGADSRHDPLCVRKTYDGALMMMMMIRDVIAEQCVQFWCRNPGSLSGTFRPSGVCHWLAAMFSEAQLSEDNVSVWTFAIAQSFDLCGECDQR